MKREYTGVGFFVDLVPKAPADGGDGRVDGPGIQSRHLDFGGGSLLYLQHDQPCWLEIYAFGDHFPEHLEEFQLSDAGFAD